MLKCLLVGIGGFIGSVARYLIGLIPLREKAIFPVKTLIINIVGAFLISLIVAIGTKNKNISPNLILMLKTGICGGFTTFSTFAFESVELFQKGHIIMSISYVLLSVLLGIFAVYFGQIIVK